MVLAVGYACSACVCVGECLGSAPVDGRIVDPRGAPIQGVRVIADRNAVESDAHGNFHLDVIEQRTGGAGCVPLIGLTLAKDGCPTQHAQPSRSASRQDFVFTCSG
jgi:hypothetical protein